MLLKLTEEAEQTALVLWFERQFPKHAKLMVHIPNGQNVGLVRGYRLKKSGLRKGFPDLALLVPRGAYAGLFIEFKTKKGRPTAEQREYVEALKGQGYMATVCYGFEEARSFIESYMKLYKDEEL